MVRNSRGEARFNLHKIRTWRVFAFHKKFVQFGSVCIALNSNNSFKHSSIILVAIYDPKTNFRLRDVSDGARKRLTDIVSICLAQPSNYSFAYTYTVNMFHHQDGVCASLPNPWDFIPKVITEEGWWSEFGEIWCFTGVVTFICEFAFHNLNRENSEKTVNNESKKHMYLPEWSDPKTGLSATNVPLSTTSLHTPNHSLLSLRYWGIES